MSKKYNSFIESYEPLKKEDPVLVAKEKYGKLHSP